MATSIPMAGVGKMADLWFDSQDADEVELRRTAGVEALKKEYEVTGAFDAIRFVRYTAPVPILFQFARFDRFSTESMRVYASAASGRKKVLWYSTGHALNDPQALIDRAAWLQKEIGLDGAVCAVTVSKPQ